MRSMLSTRTGAACLVATTVGTLVQFAVTPLDESDSAAQQVASAAAHLSRMRAAAWLDLTILLTVPALLYIAALAGGWRSRLAVTEKTVRNNVSNIFAKLQVPDRAAAIVRAREAGSALGADPRYGFSQCGPLGSPWQR